MHIYMLRHIYIYKEIINNNVEYIYIYIYSYIYIYIHICIYTYIYIHIYVYIYIYIYIYIIVGGRVPGPGRNPGEEPQAADPGTI